MLDDGWFGGRRDDSAGLRNWFASPDVWPHGLHPLVEHVSGLGMQFGLWVEAEMVNPDSDLARRHPDWLMALPGRMPPTARGQQVLDVANPLAFGCLLERLDALLAEYPISYLKWDHNRDLVDAVHAGEGGRRRPGVHAQTAACIGCWTSCAGGGRRVDLGILHSSDRIWTSDCNDPLERQQVQRWTGLMVPPELMGAHVGPSHARRTSDLSFRAGTALFGHFGIEWDLVSAGADALAELEAWITVYKRFRAAAQLPAGARRRRGRRCPGARGGIRQRRGGAVRVRAAGDHDVRASAVGPAARPDAGRSYRVRPVQTGQDPLMIGTAAPRCWTPDGVTLPGSALTRIGLPGLLLGPEQLVLLHV